MTLRLSLCNEQLAHEGKDISAQCRIAAALGYAGLEIAPGTLDPVPHRIDRKSLVKIRNTVAAEGLSITGLHWLLSPYPALSVTDPARQAPTLAVLRGLIRCCAELGGRVLVHGSPAQRQFGPGQNADTVRSSVIDLFGELALEAERVGVTYCLEPLSPHETPFINSVNEAVDLVRAVGSRSFLTMIDTSAAGLGESEPVADLMRRWLPTGLIAHIQFNDTNRGAPGTGSDPFIDMVQALHDCRWHQSVAIEPFTTLLDATTTAAYAIATLKTCSQVVARGRIVSAAPAVSTPVSTSR